MKKFVWFAGASALTALAAGAAYLATREENRKYLTQASDIAKESYVTASKVFGNAKHAVSAWYAHYQQNRDAFAAFQAPIFAQNGSAPKQPEYTHSN